ncbi:helix-turn-helix domain-containing protein [Corallococcus sp. AS-1-6]|uniref:helix-turn-helix domain-containing protein n=1 Tax=Corallococcus sp. AS-1-6 TaxID=2874599 RepID=UPI001CC1A4C8|nr:XRE family transcriptional regulator [Corallococcus sp. AS-1-6]MBZ4373276.1 XRE family transcriptional regulator [Corallococcus sp. AS-1-6]
MLLGTPGFVPSRLVEAREARGLTQLALADQANLSRSTVSAYELGDATPSPAVLDRIATCLGVPVRLFLRPQTAPGPGATFLRAPRSVSPALSARAESWAKWAGDALFDLSDAVTLPPVDFPDFNIEDPASLTGDRIEELAVAARRYWKLGDGPISNVVWLLENKGAVVARCELGEPRLDGLSHWRGSRPTVLLASDRNSGARSRFDAAHELGHLLLHRHVAPARLRSSSEWRMLEDQAHRFAGSFLFPRSAFLDEVILVDLDSLQPLKLRWKASIKMMIKRAATLGIISPERERQLMINYNRRGYKTNEPHERDVAVELPRLLMRATEMVVDAHGPSAVQDRLPYAPHDVERLTRLPPAFFEGKTGLVLSLRIPETVAQVVAPGPPQGDLLGEVVPFAPRRPSR